MKMFPSDVMNKNVTIRTRTGKSFTGKIISYQGGLVKLSMDQGTSYITLTEIVSIQEMEIHG